MIKKKNFLVNKQFIKFFCANGFAAILNFSTRIFFSSFASYSAAIILAYLVGMVTAFVLCKIFVFESKENTTTQQMSYFVLVNVFALLQTLIISLLFADYLLKEMIHSQSFRESVAHFIGLSVPILTSFIGHKYLSFR